MKHAQRTRDAGERGYVMLIVIVVLLILVSAVAYSFRAIQNEIRAGSKFRKSELLVRAAEAGAAHRMSEIAFISDPIEILDETASNAAASWNDFPPAGTFTSNDNNPSWGDAGPSVQYRTGPVKMIWSGKVPPPGVAIGTNTYIFQLTSYAVQRNSLAGGLNIFDEGGEAAIDVGVKTWDLLPGSYSP
jgi:hypothetical protein